MMTQFGEVNESTQLVSYDRDVLYNEAKEGTPWTERVITQDKNQPKMHVLIPNFVSDEETRSEMERISHNYGKKEYFDEILSIFDDVGLDAVVHLCRLCDYQEVIQHIPKGADILNLCDGADVDGVPGPCVAKYLEENAISFYGCDSEFVEMTTSKEIMKKKFIEHKVLTARYCVASKEHPLTRESVAHMEYPLFVKAMDSYGSIGLSKDSVCHTFEACEEQVKSMQNTFEQVLVEEFIDGPEFSLLIIGDSRVDAPLDVFPPAQRVFHEDVAEDERFLSYKLVWEEGGVNYKYASVDKDADILMDLARRSYVSVSGNGFGRVDIRRRDSTNEYFVLEVNSTCGVGYDASSAEILKLGGLAVHHLVQRLLAIGPHRFPAKSSSVS